MSTVTYESPSGNLKITCEMLKPIGDYKDPYTGNTDSASCELAMETVRVFETSEVNELLKIKGMVETTEAHKNDAEKMELLKNLLAEAAYLNEGFYVVA